MSFNINYLNMHRAGYKFEICDMTNNVYDELSYWKKENFPDLKITRPQIDTDLNLIANKCLITVNGYIHKPIFNNNVIYIKNATKSMLRSKANQIGILSFINLNNNLNKLSITTDMISGETSFSLYEKALITFNEEVKIPILIIAGYMLFEDGETLYRVSPNTLVLRLDRLNYIEKLYELNKFRDIFTELNIPVSSSNPSLIDGVIARQDSTIIKFLSLNNSFLLNLDINSLNLNKIYLERSNIPSTFFTETEPKFPLFGGYGKLIEYSVSRSNDKYKVYTLDSYYNNHIFSFLPQSQLEVINDHRLPEVTHRLSHAYFLNISISQ